MGTVWLAIETTTLLFVWFPEGTRESGSRVLIEVMSVCVYLERQAHRNL